MLEYAKKRAAKTDMSLLRYFTAFSDGLLGVGAPYYNAEQCEKMWRAYNDGRRMKKRCLTKAKGSGKLVED